MIPMPVLGLLTTVHGQIETPFFMPVGNQRDSQRDLCRKIRGDGGATIAFKYLPYIFAALAWMSLIILAGCINS